MGFWWGNVRERNHFEDLGLDRRNNIKMDLQEVEWGIFEYFSQFC